MIGLKSDLRVFVYNEYVDLRAGFDKLSMFVREKMNAVLVDGDLFLFLGNNRKRLKAICYDGTGLEWTIDHFFRCHPFLPFAFCS
jgi:transposase